MFKIGDRVRVINEEEDCGSKKFKGKEGKIVVINNFIGVEFDEYVYGHSCQGRGKDLYCWNFYAENLELITEPQSREYKLIITNTNKTILIDKSTGKKAIARCHTNDTYDLGIGVKLAMDRLNGIEPIKEEIKSTPRKIGDLPIGTKVKMLKMTHGTDSLNKEVGIIEKHKTGHNNESTYVRFNNGKSLYFKMWATEHEYFEVIEEVKSDISSASETEFLQLEPTEIKKCKVLEYGNIYYKKAIDDGIKKYNLSNVINTNTNGYIREDVDLIKSTIYNVLGKGKCFDTFKREIEFVAIEHDNKVYLIDEAGIEYYEPKLFDSFNKSLKVGDTVHIFYEDGNYLGIRPVRNNLEYRGDDTILYVDRIAESCCSDKNDGKPSNDWRVIKIDKK